MLVIERQYGEKWDRKSYMQRRSRREAVATGFNKSVQIGSKSATARAIAFMMLMSGSTAAPVPVHGAGIVRKMTIGVVAPMSSQP
jgi:hypothetical protein